MRESLRLPFAVSAAGAVGGLAYSDLTTLYLLAAFPLLVTLPRTRWGAGAVAWAFYLVPCALLVPVLQNWVAGSGQPLGPVAIFGYPLLLSLLLATPFLLVNPAAPPRRRAAQILAALAVLTLPPLGLIAWINPLLLAAALFPGVGFLMGLLLAGATIGLLAAHGWRKDGHPAARAALAVLMVSSLAAHALDQARKPPLPPIGWYGVDTQHGPGLPTPEARAFRAALLAEQARAFLAFPDTELLVFPESLLPDFQADDVRRLAPLGRRLHDSGVDMLLGATPRTGEDSWRNQIIRLTRDGQGEVVAESRVPVPVGNWRIGGRGVPLDVFRNGLVELRGRTAHITICYEEFPLWAHMQVDRAEILISVANQWMLTTSISRFQATSVRAIQRLTRKPMLRATNTLPSKAKGA